MMSLQKLHARFHVCPFVFIYKVLWYAPCTNFVTSEALVDDGICRSTADVQLFICISDSNPSVLLNQSINSFKIVRRSWSVWTAIFVPLWNLYTLWYIFLFIIQFLLTLFCETRKVLSSLTTTISWRHVGQQWCYPKAEPTCLHCDCRRFTERNGYRTTWLDLAQFVLCIMSARMSIRIMPFLYLCFSLTPCTDGGKIA